MWWLPLALADPVSERCVATGRLDEPAAEELRKLRERSFADPDTVEAQARRLQESWPRCPSVWMLGAALERSRGKPEEALALLDRAVAEAPGWAEVHRAHAVAHAHAGDTSHLAAASELSPSDTYLEVLRIRALDVSQQTQAWRDLLERSPEEPDAILAALDGLESAGRPLEARELGIAALERTEDSRVVARVAALRSPFEPPAERREHRPGEFRILDDGTEEVIVYSPERARTELTNRLDELGWVPAESIKGGVRYRTTRPVQPFVDVFDDGRVEVQKSGVVTLPEPAPGVRLGRTGARFVGPGISFSEVISARKLRPDRTRLMEDIWLEVTRWRQAKTRQTFGTALNETLPTQLQDLWDDGVPLYGRGTLETREERRIALLAHWGSRACSPEGEAAAEIIGRFLRLEVDESSAPLQPEEVARAEREAQCGRVLREPAP